MNLHEPNDPQFEDNLAAFGASQQVPDAPTEELRARCLAALNNSTATTTQTHRKKILRRSALFSTVGIAASIALVLAFFQFSPPSNKVEAAVILQSLNAQIQENPLVEITLKALRVHGALVEGRVTASKEGACGDVQVHNEDANEPINVDLTFGASSQQTWLLFRKFVVSDPGAMALLSWFIPPGQEVLLKLPHEQVEDFSMDLSLIKFDGLAEVVQNLIAAGDSVGATVTNRGDGLILLEIPMNNANAFEAAQNLHSQLAPPELIKRFHGSAPAAHSVHFKTSVNVSKESAPMTDSAPESDNNSQPLEKHAFTNHLKLAFNAHKHNAQKSASANNVGNPHHALYTLWMLYDPTAKVVSSLGVRDIGPDAGSINVDFRQGAIDPTLLDPARVSTESTRILDLEALKKLMQGIENLHQK